MPLVDLPLEQLKSYTGRNPRPTDFDAYWTRALAEMDSLGCGYKVTRIESPKSVEWFDLHFIGVGGARIRARYARPAGLTEPRPAVLQFHGYKMGSCDWADTMKYVGLGFSFLAIDVRGQGGLSEDPGSISFNTLDGHITRGLSFGPERLFFRSVYLDCAQLANIVFELPNVDPTRVATIGSSQGGSLSLVTAALEPRISRCVSEFPFLCDFKRVWEMDLAKDAYQDMRDWLRKYDPKHNDIDKFWNDMGYIDIQNFADRIRAEVLMGTGLMDTICPPSTQFAAFNKLTSKKQMSVFPDFGHEAMRGFNDQAFQFLAQMA